jgi:hypothetical protein
MRNLSDYAAKEFASLGLPAVEAHGLNSGMQCILFADDTRVAVSPFASDAEIIAATRKAFNMVDDNIETTKPEPVADIAPEAPAPTANSLPVAELAPVPDAPKPSVPARRPSAPSTPGDHASSIQDMMQQHVRAMNDIRDASIETLRLSLERQRNALAAAPKKVAEKIDGQTEDFLSIMGQFTNDLGV